MRRLWGRILQQVRSPARQVALSVAFGQTILLAITPLLALLYPIEVIGRYQIVYSVAIVAQVVATGGIEYILPGITRDSIATSTYRRGLMFLAFFVVAATGVTLLTWRFFGAPPAEIAAFSAAVALAFGSTALDNARLLRRGDHVALVRRNYLAGSTSAVIQIGAFVISPSLATLVVGLVLGRAVSLVIRASRGMDVSAERPAETSTGSQPVRRGASLEWIVGIVLSTATLQAPIVFTGHFLGPVAAAQIALAIRIVSAPASLLGGGVAQGFIFATSQMLRDRPADVVAYIRHTQVRLARLSLFIGVGTLILGPPAVLLLFTDEWSSAAVVVAILALPYAVQLVNRATTPLYPMLDATRPLLVIQVCRFLGTGVLMALALIAAPGELYWIAAAIAGSALIFQVFFFFYTARLVGSRDDH